MEHLLRFSWFVWKKKVTQENWKCLAIHFVVNECCPYIRRFWLQRLTWVIVQTFQRLVTLIWPVSIMRIAGIHIIVGIENSGTVVEVWLSNICFMPVRPRHQAIVHWVFFFSNYSNSQWKILLRYDFVTCSSCRHEESERSSKLQSQIHHHSGNKRLQDCMELCTWVKNKDV